MISRFRVIFVHFLPCVSLVILNILLFSAMRRAERRRQKLMASRVKAEQAGMMKGWVEMIIIIAFILCSVGARRTEGRGMLTTPP